MKYTLSKKQIDILTIIGTKRQDFNKKINKPDAHGFKGNGYKIHTQGVMAEFVVSKLLNLKWIPLSENYENLVADVGGNVQVRSTDYKYGNLLIHEKDKDNQPFILVRLHDFPQFELVGWVLGEDAKNKEFWEDGSNVPAFKGRACYRYPAKLLNPMSTLPYI